MAASPRPNSTIPIPRSRSHRLIAAGTTAAIVVASVVGVAYAASAAPAYDPADAIKPVASYTFDGDTGTTVTDSSGSGNNAVWKGTPAYVTGVSGQAASVSGGANYLKLPLVAGQTDASASFSYEFWMSEASRTSYGPIVSNQNFASCNNKGLSLYNQTTPGVLEACWGQTSGGTKEYVHGATPNILNAWHHVAVVVDRTANTATFYVDGVQKSTAPAGSITASAAFNSGLAFNIGGLGGSENDTGDGYVNASIDNFSFFNAAIPGAQVAADYTASKPTTVNYTVAFNGNGSDGGTTASQNLAAGQSAALTANGFTRSGYKFMGWATNASGPVVYKDAQSVTDLATNPGATVSLYAVWNRYRAVGDTVAPVVSYDFTNDSGTTVTDSSGNGNAGTWSGTPSYASAVSGNGAYVNSPAGSNKGVNFFSLPLVAGQTDASASFSYVFWMNEAATSSDSPIVSNQDFLHCYNKGTTLYNTAGNPGILRACFGQNGTSTSQNYLANVSANSVIGAWHQVAMVADRTAGTMTTYVDGEQTAQSTALTSAFNLMSGRPFAVGAEGSGTDTTDGFINATIDNFDFYNAPISAAQIQNEYAAVKANTAVSNTGSTIDKGFVTDTFRAPQVREGGTVSQPVSGLWNGNAVTSYTKVSGDDWLSVGTDGTVTGTAPSGASQDPGTITVKATDGTTTSQITVEVGVIGAKEAPQLATATWNLWDAGSHVNDSTFKDLAVIASNGLDVIGVQEDNGTVATALAAALGWHAVEGAGGVGIISAYPLDADAAARAATAVAVPAVGATAHVLGQDIRVWSAGLDDAAYGPEAACQGGVSDPAALVAAEKGTDRFTQAQGVAAAVAHDVPAAGATPVIVLSDLQSPSASDWTAATAGAHCGVGPVAWPAPALLDAAGLHDSFRVANPDPATAAGTTWSPLVATNPSTGTPEPQDRIDYIHFAGDSLKVLGSNTLVAGWPSVKNIPGNSWTSNHRAVVTTFSVGTPVPPKPAPVVSVAKPSLVLQLGATPTAAELLAKVGATSTTDGATFALDSSTIDFTKTGSYTADVTATDPATGKVSEPAGVTVKIVPVVKVTLAQTAADIALDAGKDLTEADVEAALKPALNVPGTITIDLSKVKQGASGAYPVTITGTDDDGFTASVDAQLTITVAPTSTESPSATASPSAEPTDSPSATATASPSTDPTDAPTDSPSATATASPTTDPTADPTDSPSATPTPSTSATASAKPSATATAAPSSSAAPSASASGKPGKPTASSSASVKASAGATKASSNVTSAKGQGSDLASTGANAGLPLALAALLLLLGAIALAVRLVVIRRREAE
ncbi:LamG-like jellyroll fold domain-containing protein [Arthrobacter sp. ERGS1:01]|uniref:LamG-like jellyroll fold domain-containing protein n=1 Tax=Arthrobacter sp. ERGS1:01 TaxID=1704044 RepID=UPI0006B506FA|nr:LamG-like jellyroll fold domain-containing protein [Arthrobacter sp. ERGS1:01]